MVSSFILKEINEHMIIYPCAAVAVRELSLPASGASVAVGPSALNRRRRTEMRWAALALGPASGPLTCRAEHRTGAVGAVSGVLRDRRLGARAGWATGAVARSRP